jgi:hypothetical protein
MLHITALIAWIMQPANWRHDKQKKLIRMLESASATA